VPEAWLLAMCVAGAAPNAAPEAPPADLLEFLGEWTEEEARLIDEYRPAQARAGTTVGKDVKHEDGDRGSGARSRPRD